MGVRDELEKMSRLRDAVDPTARLRAEVEKLNPLQTQIENAGLGLLRSDSMPGGLEYLTREAYRTPDIADVMLIQGPEERAAESFMDGLREHADKLEAGLREDQELQMLCYHGPEQLRVLEISMPSLNVVSLRCLNADGDETHVTGHMHAVTFSFVIHTIVPPEVKRPIGFRMPSEP